MKTIRLRLGDLRVESFRTTSAAAAQMPGEPETWEDVLTCAGGCDSAGCRPDGTER